MTNYPSVEYPKHTIEDALAYADTVGPGEVEHAPYPTQLLVILAAEVRRLREREPLVQEIVAAVASSDDSDHVSSIKVDWENTDEDGTVYPRMWLREAAQLCMERFGKPEGQSE